MVLFRNLQLTLKSTLKWVLNSTGRKMSFLKRIVNKIQSKVSVENSQQEKSVQITVYSQNRDGENQMHTFVSKAGRTILQTCRENQIDIEHFCGGTCSCGTCFIRVINHPENLSISHAREDMVLGYSKKQLGYRLSCQAKILGDIVFEVIQ